MVAIIKSKRLTLLVALISISILVYLNGLNNGFVSDDKGLLSQPTVHDLRTAILTLFYKFDLHSPAYFRIVNILFHAGSTAILFLIFLSFFSPFTSFLGALFFAVHPVHVESVTWISGGGYVQYSFFFLLSFFLYIKSKKHWTLYFVSLLSFVASLLSSPVALSLAIVFPLYELTVGKLKKNWPKALPYVISVGILAFPYILNIGPRLATFQAGSYQDQSTYNPLFQIPVALSSYLVLLVWPDKLTLYHSELAFSSINFVLRAVIVVGYFILLFVLFKKNKKLFFWASLYVVSLLPTLTPFRVAWIVAERYVYLGSISCLLLIAYGAEILFKKYGKAIVLLISIFALLLSMRTIIRNFDWKDEDSLWIAASRTSPSSWVNHNNLGDVYARRGEYGKSIQEFEIAIALNPQYADAYNNMANVLVKLGKRQEAYLAYEQAVALNPNLWQAYFNMSTFFYELQDMIHAEEYLLRAIRINQNDSKLYAHLGVIYLNVKNLRKAEGAFTESLQIDRNNQMAQRGLAEVNKIKHNP